MFHADGSFLGKCHVDKILRLHCQNLLDLHPLHHQNLPHHPEIGVHHHHFQSHALKKIKIKNKTL